MQTPKARHYLGQLAQFVRKVPVAQAQVLPRYKSVGLGPTENSSGAGVSLQLNTHVSTTAGGWSEERRRVCCCTASCGQRETVEIDCELLMIVVWRWQKTGMQWAIDCLYACVIVFRTLVSMEYTEKHLLT